MATQGQSTVSSNVPAAAATARTTADVSTDTDNTVKGAPKSSSSISTDAAVPASVSNEQDEITDEKVYRFLITNLQGGRGYAKTDYRIDLLQSRHGLYDIAVAVFDIMHKEKLTTDSIYSHLWDMTFNNKTYSNGWRRQHPISDEWDRPATDEDVDTGEPRLFSGLNNPLEKGQKGRFGGESASFDFVLESITDDSSFHSSAEVTYPHVSKVGNTISCKVEDDWITPSQKSQCNQMSTTWKNFYSGNNSWKCVKYPGERKFQRAKPSPPEWRNELEIMGLLINADCKFKKSWTNIMQYTFVDRTESACSMRWYQLKKEDYRLEWFGRGKSSTEKIQLAKRLARSIMKRQLERKPKKEPHPYANYVEEHMREYARRDMEYENEY